MSKVAIKGNASGTGTFTIAAPVGTGTDRTLTLPDEAGTVLTSASTFGVSQLPSQLSVNASASSGSLAIDSAGRVTMPYHPAFGAVSVSAGVLTTDSTFRKMGYTSELVDIGGNYDASNSRFTAPVAGTYMIAFSMLQLGGMASQIALFKNGSIATPTYGNARAITATNEANVSAQYVIYLSASDYVEMFYKSDSGGSIFGSYGSFAGFLIG